MENQHHPAHHASNADAPFLSNPAKLTLALGIMTGVALISTIGFLSMISKNGSTGTTKKAATAAAANTNSAAAASADPSVAVTGTVKAVSKDDHILGGANPKVYLVEYSDLECPFSKRHHPTMQQIVDTYGDQVAWVYRHYPLTDKHPMAVKEAEATECAAEIGGNDKFWALDDAIFNGSSSTGNSYTEDSLVALAKANGINESKFRTCLTSGKYTAKVKQDLTDGTAAGVDGTPATILLAKNGTPKIVSGAYPFATFKTLIDAAIK